MISSYAIQNIGSMPYKNFINIATGFISGIFTLGMIFYSSKSIDSEQIDTPWKTRFLNWILVQLFGLYGAGQVALFFGVSTGLIVWYKNDVISGLQLGAISGAIFGFSYWLSIAVMLPMSLVHHFILRFVLHANNLLPWKLIPFLDHCVDLIFLRRIGGGYIFVHRLLMEHFAEMYVETPNSKGNPVRGS